MVICDVSIRASWVKAIWKLSVPWVLLIEGFGIHGFSSISVDVEPVDTEDHLYYTILYKGLEQSGILISAGCPGTNPPQIPRDNYAIFAVLL